MGSPVPVTPQQEAPSLRAWRWIAEQEGGGRIHNVPGDPGGTTKWGFAQRYNPDINVADLTFTTAYQRFLTHYWKPLYCETFPLPVALVLVNYTFNAGADDSIPALQRAAGASIDGKIGARTIHAVLTRYAHNPRRFINDFLSYQLLKYAASPRLEDNRGWLVRTLAVRGFVEREIA